MLMGLIFQAPTKYRVRVFVRNRLREGQTIVTMTYQIRQQLREESRKLDRNPSAPTYDVDQNATVDMLAEQAAA